MALTKKLPPVYEQSGYYINGDRCFDDNIQSDCSSNASKFICGNEKKEEGKCCYNIQKINFEDGTSKYHLETNYFIGIDWYENNVKAIYVQPKQNSESKEIDVLKLLFNALQEPENFDYLQELYEVDFDARPIIIEQKNDKLSPFLIIQFLQVLKQIVRRGLKKTYYPITQNLEAKVKGKILINQTIKTDIFKNRFAKNVCKYDEFGYNGEENRILKKALLFSKIALANYQTINTDSISELISYINPAFESVSDEIDTDRIKSFKPNPLYKEYERAIKLAKLILKRYSYNISLVANQEIATPPYWIDMSKLFELYVLKLLKQVFSDEDEVIYQFDAGRLYPDFLINGREKMVIDAKYKRYDTKTIEINDIRQICAYSRMERVINKLGTKTNIVDCLVIYISEQAYTNEESTINMLKTNLKSNKLKDYSQFYKLGISLPTV